MAEALSEMYGRDSDTEHRYFRLRKRDWKWVHIRTINTAIPCWNENELIDHAHFISALIAHVKLVLWQQAYLDTN